jgi:uncharacterized protein with HEPN domain
MLGSAEKAQEFIRGISRREFLNDEKTQFATARALEIIGEAARVSRKKFDTDFRPSLGNVLSA